MCLTSSITRLTKLCTIQFAHSSLNDAIRTAYRHFKPNISRMEKTSLLRLRNLMKERVITIKRADKSRQIVVMSSSSYSEAVQRLLDDTLNYTRVPYNEKFRVAALTIRAINTFGNFLPNGLRKDLPLFTRNPNTRNFYCLPKTHKDRDKWVNGLPPMRPICPDIRTESSSSGKFIAAYLQPLVQRIPSYISNSYELITKLNNIKVLPDTAVLLTADIESLYPSIPVREALDTVTELLSDYDGLERKMADLIIKLLDIQLA